MRQKVEEAVSFIRKTYAAIPRIGVVLGSGLGSFINEMKISAAIDYSDIPNFPLSTVEGHRGKLYFGEIEGKEVVAMAGRFHYYEGYTTPEVVLPIRVLKYLGISTLLISNAAGGTNNSFAVGDLMVIKDHISFFTENPLIGKNDSHFGPRFPDMSEPYKKHLIEKIKNIAKDKNIILKEGVYAGVTGPTFETRAEYRLLKMVGADAVGMSTVQEVIAAAHMLLPVLGVSVITDIGIRDDDNTITHEDVLKAAKDAEPKLTALFKELIKQI